MPNPGFKTEPIVRLWKYVEKIDGACWIFVGKRDRKGYGLIADSARPARFLKAHRVVYEWAHDAIPNGAWVLHRCDNSSCVNPDHLFLGDAKSNAADMVAKGRHANQIKTHCVNGHPLSGDNLRLVNSGHGGMTRQCVICRGAALTKWRATR